MLKPRFVAGPLWQYLCPAWYTPTTTTLRFNVKQPARSASIANTSARPRLRRSISAAYRSHSTSPVIRHRVKRIIHDDSSLDASVESLYTRLNASAIEGDIKDCQRVVEYLLQKRGERLSVTLYNALILANVDSVSGGAWRVRKLLEEMEIERYVPDTVTCHNILKVLAVHPDHLLRADVLHRMKENWFALSVDGQHDVAAGWLREGCLELAMNTLDKLQRDGSRVEPWLLDMFVYSLCDAGEIEAAYHMLQARRDTGELNISGALWHYFLDAATHARHFAGTELAWRAKVRLGQLQVSTGICENALATACMHGSPALATEIFGYFTKRGDPSTHIHYQLLIDSYLNCDPPDINRAISVLLVMALEKVEPTKWQTRSLFMHVRQSAQSTAETLGIISDLHEQGRIIPLALLNMMIEVFIYREQYAAAIDWYKNIPTLLSATPEKAVLDLETFSLLIRACELSDPPNVQQAESLMSEMKALGKESTEDMSVRLANIRRAVQTAAADAPRQYTSSSIAPPAAASELLCT